MVRRALLLAAAFAVGSLASAQNVRLSGPMAHDIPGDVESVVVSPDGLRAVLQVDPDEDDPWGGANEKWALYGVRTDGSQPPVLLGSDLDFEGPIVISPDSAHVVCLVQAESPYDRLLSLPIDGGATVVLDTGYIEAFRVAPGSQRVVYTRDAELFSVPIDGSQPPVQLSVDEYFGIEFVLSPDGQRVAYASNSGVHSVPVDGSQAPLLLYFHQEWGVVSIDVSPDGQRVLMYLDPSFGDDLRLMSVPIDGSQGAVQLNRNLLGSVKRGRHAFTPDGSRVLYLDEVSGQVQLFSVPVDRSTYAQRIDAVPASGDVMRFRLDPLGTRAVYVADQDTDVVLELYSVPASGGQAPVRLSGPMVAGGSIGGSGNWFLIASDGARVAYVADQETNDVFELYSVPIDGSAAAVKLGGAMVAGGDVVGGTQLDPTFQISLDGARVAWVADGTSDGVFELFSAPIDGSAAPVRLSATPTPGGGVGFFLENAAAGRVLYLGDQDENDAFELFSAPFDGSLAPRKLSPPLPEGKTAGDVAAFELTPDERFVVYAADQDVDRAVELYRAHVDGSSAPQKLNPPFAPETFIYDFSVAPDGARAVYTSYTLTLGKVELYSVPMDGSGAALQISAPISPDEDIVHFALSGSRVVYQVSSPGPEELFTIPIDGSQPAVQLNPTLPSSTVSSFAFSPDGTRVVYLSDQDVDERYELYSVPSDGSAAPTRLGNAPVAGGDVIDFVISADSSRVVFRGDLLVDNSFELFAAPLAGGPRLRLNRPLVAGGNVGTFRIAPDSVGVVYVADGDVDSVLELFAVPFGTPVAFELSDALVTGGDVNTFEICPDSSRVVFVADAEVNDRLELYSVPIDRSQPPARLNGAFTSGTGVQMGHALAPTLWITADSRRVIYRANPAGSIFDFFGVPVDGSAPPTRLTNFTTNIVVPGYQVSHDGRWLLFVAVLSTLPSYELFRVPTDATRPPLRLHAPLVTGGRVIEDFAVTSHGRAVYRADQLQDEVVELFSSVIAGPARDVGARPLRGEATR